MCIKKSTYTHWVANNGKKCIVKMPLSAQNKKKGERRKDRKEGGIESTQCVVSKSMKEWEGNVG